MEELTSNYLNLSAHKTEGITRTKTMRFYPTVPTGEVTLEKGTEHL